MRRCCVRGCRSNFSKPYVSVFTFPKDTVICKLWLKNIGRPDMKVRENVGVCIKHFEKHCIKGIDSSEPHRKKITIKHGSVPTIFEDVCSSDDSCKMEEEVQSLDNITRMQSKSTKSSLASASDSNTANTSSKQEKTHKASVKSLKKSSTTDRPIIAVIKAEDLIADDMKNPEHMEEDNDCIVEQSSSSTNSFSVPSPYKNLPNVSVCLKEEDRVLVLRELKGVKRSPSTGSNSSTGSSETQKLVAKRRKIEKPSPVVIGRTNDCYCWVCHRENVTLSCIACPRAYHSKCAGEMNPSSNDWVCPECQRILSAENVDTRSSTLAEISLDKLGALLKLSLNKMKQRAPIAFHQPVSLEHYPLYLHYVIHPMDFSLLEKNIKQKQYGCTEAFLADVKWIAHNSCVFNGTQHPLSTNAKNLVKSCDHDMQEIEVCPDCFVHSVIRNKYWFSEVCRKPHPLVWAKLKGFPYWPAKVVRILDGNVDARFFGAHDRAWVPVSQCYHLSKEMPTTSKPKKKGNYEVALDELNVHVHIIIQKFGSFEYASYRTNFNPQNKYLMYHGIDIDKVANEDISFDTTASPSKIRFHSPEKESRFAAFMESENEKFNGDETKLDESQPGCSNAKSPQLREETATFQVKDKKHVLSLLPERIINTVERKEGEASTADSEKKSDTDGTLPKKKSETISASDQLRKLELALERIKGYVSVGTDSEKENADTQKENVEVQSSENEEKTEKESTSNEENTKGKKTTEVLSPILNKIIDLPIIETSDLSEASENVNLSLEATKKTDSFFLKLNETIESCKAKLGISEIADNLSSDNESVGDENASRSDEDEEDEDEDEEDSSAEEENSSLSEDEEAENMEASEEELENDNEIRVNKLGNGSETEDSGGSDSEEEDSKSESSCTDIEACDENQASSKKHEGNNERNDSHIEDSIKELSDANESSLTNPDMQMPEVTVDETGALEIVGGSSSNDIIESENDSKENTSLPDSDKQHGKDRNSKFMLSQKISVAQDDQDIPDSLSSEADNSSNSAKNSDKTTENKLPSVSLFQKNYNEKSPDTMSPTKKNIDNLSSPKNISPLGKNNSEKLPSNINNTNRITKKNEQNQLSEAKPINLQPCKTEPVESNNNNSNNNNDDDEEEEDDDIFICNSPQARPKTPPVIVIDDDQENEESSILGTFAVKTSPHSTSAESLVDDLSDPKRSDNQHHNSPPNKRQSVNGQISRESISDSENEFEKREVLNKNTKNSESQKKRKLVAEESSDDEIQIVVPLKKSVRTGAIRTFNKPETSHNLNSAEIRDKVPMSSHVEESEAQSNTPNSSIDSDKNEENNDGRLEINTVTSSILKSPIIDTSNLSDKDKEILFLKSKLNCVLTAYQIQTWKCAQEREEIRHNMNLVIMEMRACLESDKKQAIETLSKTFEQEKLKCIEETKKKQWCAFCQMESRYSCCWNTSYCSFKCQKKHFNEHRNLCTQIKNKNSSETEKQKNTSPDCNENKKVIIVNMKATDSGKMSSDLPTSIGSQSIPASKPQIQVVSAKNQLQIASSANSVSPIQFVLAPIKPAEPAVVTASSSLTPLTTSEQNLDATRVISNIRNKSCDLGTAINLLQKMNQENDKKKEVKKPKETSLEEVYFPSPPKVTFEGYDSVSPDPSIVIEEPDDSKIISDSDVESSEKSEEVVPEQDVVLSDTDDVDNEMVSIGHGIEVKAKFLNKCLVYGKTAKKLTRCLVDVIFPDAKLLAACSAFGQKSNVTKLTRAALPARKVAAVIDFVSKRFPDVSRSEIVLAINMKCKEARVILSKLSSGAGKNTTSRRSLAREREDESDTAVTSTSSASALSPIISTVAGPIKSSPNVVCIKSSNSSHAVMPFSFSTKPQAAANIFRCTPQILIRPKSVLTSAKSPAAVVKTSSVKPLPKRRETIRDILAGNANWSLGNKAKEGTKLVVLPDTVKPTTPNTQPVTVASTTTTSSRPYIIIGPHVNAVKQPSPAQHPVVSNTSPIKK